MCKEICICVNKLHGCFVYPFLLPRRSMCIYVCMCVCLKWLYSKQPKLGLTQEFVVDYAHALWVVHSTKRLVTLMLLKWFLSYSFIYFMYRILNEHF